MLFVCEECGCIDSTMFAVPGLDNTKINMTIHDMQGETNETFNILSLTNYQRNLASGEVNREQDPLHPKANDIDIENFEPQELKYPEQVLMLCSECNTGTWLSNFEKIKATKGMKEVADSNLYKSLGEDRELDMILEYAKEHQDV